MSEKEKKRKEAVESMATNILSSNRQNGGSMSYEKAKEIAIRAEKINRENIRSNP